MRSGGVRVVVVGAGIAGLATAIALQRSGIQVEVLERARALSEVGAALSLGRTRSLPSPSSGSRTPRYAVGSADMAGSLRSPSGAVIIRGDEGQLRRALGGPTIAIHRADLQRYHRGQGLPCEA